jgi:glycerol-3-phosphate acyltransferase PlsY
MLESALLVVAAYLVGSIPFGWLVAKGAAGIDIRQHGSGNIGATNVGRVLGLRFFLLVFFLDFCKGAAPVAAALVWPGSAGTLVDSFRPPLVGLAAILGHVFPLYLKLRGGKGVATAIGVVILLAPRAAAVGLVAWVLLVLATRMVSVGSIGFAVGFAATFFVTTPDPFAAQNLGQCTFVIIVLVLVIARHRENLRRIYLGTESRVRLPWDRRDQSAGRHSSVQS